MKILGIDPDTKNTGIAVVEFPEARVVWVGVASSKGRLVQDRLVEMAESLHDAVDEIREVVFWELEYPPVVIEWQALRPKGEKNPNSIVDLNGIVGMCVGAFCRLSTKILTPTPVKWKGSVPKAIHQKRILSKVVIDSNSGFDALTKTQQGHVIDAIGLALWGKEQQ